MAEFLTRYDPSEILPTARWVADLPGFTSKLSWSNYTQQDQNQPKIKVGFVGGSIATTTIDIVREDAQDRLVLLEHPQNPQILEVDINSSGAVPLYFNSKRFEKDPVWRMERFEQPSLLPFRLIGEIDIPRSALLLRQQLPNREANSRARFVAVATIDCLMAAREDILEALDCLSTPPRTRFNIGVYGKLVSNS